MRKYIKVTKSVESRERTMASIPVLENKKKNLEDENQKQRSLLDDQNNKIELYVNKINTLEIENEKIPMLSVQLNQKTESLADTEKRLNKLIAERDNIIAKNRLEYVISFDKLYSINLKI